MHVLICKYCNIRVNILLLQGNDVLVTTTQKNNSASNLRVDLCTG